MLNCRPGGEEKWQPLLWDRNMLIPVITRGLPGHLLTFLYPLPGDVWYLTQHQGWHSGLQPLETKRAGRREIENLDRLRLPSERKTAGRGTLPGRGVLFQNLGHEVGGLIFITRTETRTVPPVNNAPPPTAAKARVVLPL